MKKLGLVSALSLGLVLLAGCDTLSTTQNFVDISSSDEMISMYNESNAMTCNLSYDSEDEHGTSVMYIKDGMISQKTESNVEGEDMVMYTLARDGKMYVWGNIYGEGVGMSASYEMNIEQEFGGFDEIDENTKVACAKGVKDGSVFDLPADVEFTSMDEWLEAGDIEYEEYEENMESDENGEVEESGEIEENNEVVENDEVEENSEVEAEEVIAEEVVE